MYGVSAKIKGPGTKCFYIFYLNEYRQINLVEDVLNEVKLMPYYFFFLHCHKYSEGFNSWHERREELSISKGAAKYTKKMFPLGTRLATSDGISFSTSVKSEMKTAKYPSRDEQGDSIFLQQAQRIYIPACTQRSTPLWHEPRDVFPFGKNKPSSIHWHEFSLGRSEMLFLAQLQ